jgi:hypothetical protein
LNWTSFKNRSRKTNRAERRQYKVVTNNMCITLCMKTHSRQIEGGGSLSKLRTLFGQKLREAALSMKGMRRGIGSYAFSLALIAASGCAATSNQTSKMTLAAADPPGKSSTIPDVFHCALVTISSPVLYACNGKVYSEHQLARLRAQAQQQHANQLINAKAATASKTPAQAPSESSASPNTNSTANSSGSSKM